MQFNSPDAFLVYVLSAFRPYLERLVVVGGFAVRLYEFHPRAERATVRVLRTFDADLATGNVRIPVAGQSLADLAAAAGFRRDFRGDHMPPVMKFVPTDASTERRNADQYTIEFLSPLVGPAAGRSGKAVAASDIQRGVTAQRLRYLDLLLEAPWPVPLAGLPGIPVTSRTLEPRVPHPGLFIVQKVLISGEPNRLERRPKDMAYVYQVASLFRRELPALAGEVRERMSGNAAWRKWLARFRQTTDTLFAGPHAAGVTEAHRVLQAELTGTGMSVPSPAMIQAGVTLFLEGF